MILRPSPGWVGLGMQELHWISVAEKVCFGKWGFFGVRSSMGISEWTWRNLFMVSHLPDGRLSCCYLSMAVPSCRNKGWEEKLINAKFDYICKPGFYERKNKNDLTFKLARRCMEIEGCVIRRTQLQDPCQFLWGRSFSHHSCKSASA